MIFRVLIAAVIVFLANDSKAVEHRYALLVGSNHGDAGETPLRFAIDDAYRTGETLRTLGGFLPENVVVLEEPSADRLRNALARLNARIRLEQGSSENSLLFVFYSGHADALSLHLGGSNLPWDELRNQTVGSSARACLLVVDACRSGAATRVKGTRLTKPFALPPSETHTPEGFAILSSATAGESAQESDELQSSFFTHHFLAALRGVADSNDDGRVTLGEAYRYTADRTLASTASTMSGIQHPTYLYDLKGRTDLIITNPGHLKSFSAIRLVETGQYLLRDGGPQGVLVLEANIGRKGRTVWLKPGQYFVQRRVPERFYEGSFQVYANNGFFWTYRKSK